MTKYRKRSDAEWYQACAKLEAECDQLRAEVAELKAHHELDGACIMLMRKHLARVGIEATFAGDAANIAANRIDALRELAGELLTYHGASTFPDDYLARAAALGVKCR